MALVEALIWHSNVTEPSLQEFFWPGVVGLTENSEEYVVRTSPEK
jgi:hypothetical protein